MNKNLQNKFGNFYLKGNWGGGSGFGSSLDNTFKFRMFLEDFVTSFKIQSISDIGCGDFSYMKTLSFLNKINYFGYDIVDFIIEENKKKYENHQINFFTKDLINESLKLKVDLVLIKDLLQHLSFESIEKLFQNINPFKFLIVVEDFCEENKNIENGYYRALNLKKICLFSDPIFTYNTYWKEKNIKRIKAVYVKVNK